MPGFRLGSTTVSCGSNIQVSADLTMSMTKTDQALYESACYEGNHSMARSFVCACALEAKEAELSEGSR